MAEDAKNHSEGPDDNPEDQPEEDGPADAGTGDGDDVAGDSGDSPSSQQPLFRIDRNVIRAVDDYRRAMFTLQKRVEPGFQAAARAAKAAEPALRSYNAFVERAGADLARVIGPAVQSMSRASVVLGRIDWASLLESMRAALPPNWDETMDLALVESILNDEGIPLVFVPNNAVLKQLLAAPDRGVRLSILLTAKTQILVDCQSTLAEVTHSSLAGQLPLAKDAVASCQDGHSASGQALAVSVVETIVSNILGLDYGQAQRRLVLDLDDLPYTEIRVKAALAPIPKFYTSWWPNRGVPAPLGLSRHVSVHQADVQHFTEEDALIASMLVASVVRAVDESQHEAQPEPAT